MTADIAFNTTPARTAAHYPSHLIEHARLRDGTSVTIRPIRAGDLPLELTFVRGLSLRTRYQRLLSGRNLLPGELRRLTDIDYRREMALIALAIVDGVVQELGVARYVREGEHEAQSCDFAIVVADQWQGRGLGELLLRGLLRAARADGIEIVSGITLTENTAMIALAQKLGFRARLETGDATVTDLRWEANASTQTWDSVGYDIYADLWFGGTRP